MIYSGRSPSSRKPQELLTRRRDLAEHIREARSFGVPLDELEAELREVSDEIIARESRI